LTTSFIKHLTIQIQIGKWHVTREARKTSGADRKSPLTTTDISANKVEVPLRRYIMDALERYRQVNDEIAEIVLRLGQTEVDPIFRTVW